MAEQGGRIRTSLPQNKPAAALALAMAAGGFPLSAAGAMSLSFSWSSQPQCSLASPAFKVAGAPRGTATLTFNMVDKNLRNFAPDGASIPYHGNFSSVTYRLRADATWHDGVPVSPEDVIFSFETFKKNNPRIPAYYRRVVGAQRTGERNVTFTFDKPGDRELPQIVGELTVLPKHWWEAADTSGS
jgi:ABC-type transport system substrate-binding protein